ncbi:MAG: formylglycine-generating enzyme family protein, partial [Gammaproteobacteria bacterium]|nr:formylglycine-generating enzyme family protein [Gammaproteobacteria bacterium]
AEVLVDEQLAARSPPKVDGTKPEKKSSLRLISFGLIIIFCYILYFSIKHYSAIFIDSRNLTASTDLKFIPINGKRVTIKGKNVRVENFKVSEIEVTISLFRQFITETKYRPVANFRCQDHASNYDASWNNTLYNLKNDLPVTCVAPQDALQFTHWFNQKHNVNVHLPTLAQWLVFANEEMITSGDCAKDNLLDKSTANKLNIAKSYDCMDDHYEPAPAKKFTANRIGLFNVRGNVSELVFLCEQPDNCDNIGVVGESWRNKSDDLRKESKFNGARNDVGFRLVYR